MSPTFKSGAFIQQCFAVHPLSLSFKLLSLPDKIGVFCASCHMRHRLTVRAFTLYGGENTQEDKNITDHLTRCTTHHPDELRVSDVNVERDFVQFRCRECKRTYVIAVSLFESHRP